MNGPNAADIAADVGGEVVTVPWFNHDNHALFLDMVDRAIAASNEKPVRIWSELRPDAQSWVCVMVDIDSGERREFCVLGGYTKVVRGYVPWQKLG